MPAAKIHPFKTIVSCFITWTALSISFSKVYGQCSPAAPAAGTCSGGNGAATNGVNINGGQTYWFSGGPTTFASGVNLNGGTLRICGTLTLSNINFNSGNLVIESGGTLIINGGGDMYMNGNASINNRGTLTINRNLRMQNANNRVWNEATTAVMTVNGTIEFNSSTSTFVNKGVASFTNILVQGTASAGAICMQQNSCISTVTLTNNRASSTSYSGSGSQAAFSISGAASLNSNFASSSSVIVCRGNSSTQSGGGNWGSATVMSNCASCSFAMPVNWLYATSSWKSDNITIEWATAQEQHTDRFDIERSVNGTDYIVFKTAKAAGNSSITTKYQVIDQSPLEGTVYYRIRQVDKDGQYTYSKVLVQNIKLTARNKISIFPNPVNRGKDFTVSVPVNRSQYSKLRLFSQAGVLLTEKRVFLQAGTTSVPLQADLNFTGSLLVEILWDDGTRYVGKILVLP